MMKVFKYQLDFVDEEQELDLPYQARFIHFDLQDGIPTVWFLIDREEPRKKSQFFIIRGTGHPICYEADEVMPIAATIDDIGLVWHLLQVFKTKKATDK